MQDIVILRLFLRFGFESLTGLVFVAILVPIPVEGRCFACSMVALPAASNLSESSPWFLVGNGGGEWIPMIVP